MIGLIFKIILLTSIWVFGVKILTHEGMLLEKLGEWANKKVEDGNKFIEWLFVCEWCMPSIHSILFVLPISYFVGILDGFIDVKNILILPFIIAGASLLSGIIWNFVMLLLKYYDFIDKSEKLKHFDIKDRKQEFYNKNNNYGNVHS